MMTSRDDFLASALLQLELRLLQSAGKRRQADDKRTETLASSRLELSTGANARLPIDDYQRPIMTEPTFAIAVTFHIKPEHAEQFCTRVLQQAADSVQKEPGCFQFDVLRDEINPTTFFLYETYLNSAAFDDHRQTAHFADFSQAVADWVDSKDVRRLTILENNHA